MANDEICKCGHPKSQHNAAGIIGVCENEECPCDYYEKYQSEKNLKILTNSEFENEIIRTNPIHWGKFLSDPKELMEAEMRINIMWSTIHIRLMQLEKRFKKEDKISEAWKIYLCVLSLFKDSGYDWNEAVSESWVFICIAKDEMEARKAIYNETLDQTWFNPDPEVATFTILGSSPPGEYSQIYFIGYSNRDELDSKKKELKPK